MTIEVPYIYVYDASGLTDGTSPKNLSLDLDSDFIRFTARRIIGLTSTAAAMRLYKPNGVTLASAPVRMGTSYPLVPQQSWPASGRIVWDLDTVTRTNIGCGGNPIYTSFLGWQGVKEMDIGGQQAYDTPGIYKRLPYTYAMDLTIDWRRYTVAPVVERPRTFTLPIQTYDFELHRIRAWQTNGTPVSAFGDWAIQLYNPYGYRLSNLPVPQGWVNAATAGYQSVFPVPGLLWPNVGNIQFDVVSNICNLDAVFPKVYRLEFEGFQRIPVAMGVV